MARPSTGPETASPSGGYSAGGGPPEDQQVCAHRGSRRATRVWLGVSGAVQQEKVEERAAGSTEGSLRSARWVSERGVCSVAAMVTMVQFSARSTAVTV